MFDWRPVEHLHRGHACPGCVRFVPNSVGRVIPPCLLCCELSSSPSTASAHTRVRLDHGFNPWSPSIRAQRHWRGPLRLSSLEPNTWGAVPSLCRSAVAAEPLTVRTRTRVCVDLPSRSRDGSGGLQHGARGAHPVRRPAPQGNQQFARERDNPDLARPLALAKPALIPLR